MGKAYSFLFSRILTRMDPENAHEMAFGFIRALGAVYPLSGRASGIKGSSGVSAMGIDFPSRFGLAAGFDKNARAIMGLGALGFGHVEVGTLTAQAQPGNARPRLFRLVSDGALINRMGFNNDGSLAAVRHLARAAKRRNRPVIGVNIGKSKVTPIEDAVADYVTSTRAVRSYADYIAVNVSSPNTPGLRGLQELESLEPILRGVVDAASGKPVVVKIAPDMDDSQVIGITELALKIGLPGMIATNTTVSREGLREAPSRITEIGAGGLSGAPLRDRSLEVLKLIRSVAPADFCVISVGGVTTPADVAERITAGATLVQGYTAFIYQGPLWARSINRGLNR